MSFIKNLIAKAKAFFAKKPDPGKLETTFDYAKPTLRGYMLARSGKHRGSKGLAPDQKARARRTHKFYRGVAPGSYDYQDKIMGALLRGEFDVARVLVRNADVSYMPRRIREFAATQINTDALYSS